VPPARDDEGPVRQLRRPEDDRHGGAVAEENPHAQNQVKIWTNQKSSFLNIFGGRGVWSETKKNYFLFEKTAMWLWSQRPLQVHGDAGHPG
jgi:hypothetical protein